jgi:hypothetical protein
MAAAVGPRDPGSIEGRMPDEIDDRGREPVLAKPGTVALETALEEERSAERALVRAIIKDVAFCVPVTISICVGLIALALRGQHPVWGVWLGMAAGIGVLVGLFFGVWAAFVTKARLLDEVDQLRRRAPGDGPKHTTPRDDTSARTDRPHGPTIRSTTGVGGYYRLAAGWRALRTHSEPRPALRPRATRRHIPALVPADLDSNGTTRLPRGHDTGDTLPAARRFDRNS